MLHITASVNGENCVLKKGASVELGFPYEVEKKGMQLFTGLRDNDAHINWQIQKSNPVKNKVKAIGIGKKVNPRFEIGPQPQYIGGQSAQKRFISQNINYPFSKRRIGKSRKVLVGFTVTEKGVIENIALEHGVDSALDSAALDVVSRMPKWRPARLKGKKVSSRTNIEISFMPTGVKFKNAPNRISRRTDRKYMEVFEQEMNDEKLKDADVHDISRYLMSSTSLNWINCDRFIDSPKDRMIAFNIDLGGNRPNTSSVYTDVKIIFKSRSSVLSAIYFGESFSRGPYVPENEEVKIVALRMVDNIPHLAIKNITTSNKPVTNLAFEPMDMETLKANMLKLDDWTR
jgi:TonB family protein